MNPADDNVGDLASLFCLLREQNSVFLSLMKKNNIKKG